MGLSSAYIPMMMKVMVNKNNNNSGEVRVVALSGAYGAGKSTLAKKICGDGSEFLLPFANGLREELIFMGLAERTEVYLKPTSTKIRKLLNEHGAKRRDENSDYWVEKWLQTANGIKKFYATAQNQVFVVDDLRFMNELQALKEFSNNNIIAVWVESDEDEDDLSLFDLKLIRESADYIIKRGYNKQLND